MLTAEAINSYHLISKKINSAYLSLKNRDFNEEEENKKTNENEREDFKQIFSSKLVDSKYKTNENLDVKDAQRSFNKYVKYQVNKHFGANVLIYKQIRALDRNVMKKIKGILNKFNF